jgi:hypothetical protein
VTLTFGDLSSTLLHDAPKVLPALFATTVVVAGYWLARTYIAFHNAQECLQELDKDAKKVDISAARSAAQQAATPLDKQQAATLAADEYHLGRFVHYRVTIALIVAAAGLFLLAVWWSALTSAPGS